MKAMIASQKHGAELGIRNEESGIPSRIQFSVLNSQFSIFIAPITLSPSFEFLVLSFELPSHPSQSEKPQRAQIDVDPSHNAKTQRRKGAKPSQGNLTQRRRDAETQKDPSDSPPAPLRCDGRPCDGWKLKTKNSKLKTNPDYMGGQKSPTPHPSFLIPNSCHE